MKKYLNIKDKRKPAVIEKVLRYTPGKRHVICQSNVGIIRKCVDHINPELLKEIK